MKPRWWLVSLLLLGAIPRVSSADSAPVLAVVVNKTNPVENLSESQLRKILLGEVTQFPGVDHRKVVLVHRDPESEVYRQMLLRVLKMTPAEYQRYLLAIVFRGADPIMIKTLNSDDTAAKFVFNVPDALAVIAAAPASAAAQMVRIVRIDGKLPGEPGYGL
jgi:ABC-type phosphate transport system substrate-binding protein